MSKGQNVEWDKTPNRHNVESKNGRLVQNVKWYKKNSKVSKVESEDIMLKRVKNVKSKEMYLKLHYFLLKLLDTMYNNVKNG